MAEISVIAVGQLLLAFFQRALYDTHAHDLIYTCLSADLRQTKTTYGRDTPGILPLYGKSNVEYPQKNLGLSVMIVECIHMRSGSTDLVIYWNLEQTNNQSDTPAYSNGVSRPIL